MNTFAVAASFDRLAGWTELGAGVAAATWKENEEVPDVNVLSKR
jgi:hypothetical protein